MSSLYNNFYSSAIDVMPVQTIPLKDKLADTLEGNEKSFKQQCMDALEVIGRRQYSDNIKLIENYEMIEGRLIFQHYLHTEGYSSLITQLTAEFEMPSYLKHYDIVSQVINEMVSEWTKRPDLFNVVELGDGATNAHQRKQIELVQEYIGSRISSEISQKPLQAGIDPNKKDFNTPEEEQQYQQTIQQATQKLTPVEIQKLMDTDFLTNAEIWGNHQYKYDREYLNTPEKEAIEIKDKLASNRCFRHFYLGPTGHQQETWSPINVFYHKSPDVANTEEGDYIGRIFNLSLNTIIDRYGHLMTKDDFDQLLGEKDDKNAKWVDSQFNWVYDNYLVPFKGYQTYDLMRDHWNKYADGSIPMVDDNFYNSVADEYNSRTGFYFVTEAYWKTQKKILKITYIDPETGQLAIDIVDENFIIPKGFKESTSAFADEQEPNTYVETMVNEVWKGIKINTKLNANINKDLYLAIGPNDLQFKGDANIYGSKLPVCGSVSTSRASRGASMLDMMKPHQIGHNVAMNQLYQLAEKEIGMLMVMDVNLFPNSKDWSGEDAWGKWMLIAKNLGMLPADTSPSNVSASLAATGGSLPKVIDLNLAAQMVSRMNMAKFFEEQALKQVGFNSYRLGNFSQSSTATGIKQGVEQSYTQTESYFTELSNYIRRCNKMDLDIAQYVQSQKDDITITYIKSDLNRAFIKILGSDLLLSELGIMVSNSQEFARQLDMMRQFAVGNNTSVLTPVDVSDIIMISSPAEIRRQLAVSYSKIEQQQQQQQQMKQQQEEQTMQLEQAKLAQIEKDKQLDRETKLDVARIEAGVSIINGSNGPQQPADTGAQQDAQQNNASNIDLKQQKLELDKQRLAADIQQKQRDQDNMRAKTAADLQTQHEHVQTARILKGKKLP